MTRTKYSRTEKHSQRRTHLKKKKSRKTTHIEPIQTSIKHSYYLQFHGQFPNAPISQTAFYKKLCHKLYYYKTSKRESLKQNKTQYTYNRIEEAKKYKDHHTPVMSNVLFTLY